MGSEPKYMFCQEKFALTWQSLEQKTEPSLSCSGAIAEPSSICLKQNEQCVPFPSRSASSAAIAGFSYIQYG